jgi:hypothetical protein
MHFNDVKWIVLFLSGVAITQHTAAQIPVDKEAHHKIVLENEWVRILDGHVPPHDTTPAHIHSANSVVIFLSKTNLGIRVAGQDPVVAPVASGDIRYVDYGDKPVNHIVWDQGDSVLHFLVVELKKQKVAVDSCPIGSRPDITLRWRQKQVSAYDWVISAGRQGEIPPAACARVLIVPATGAFSFFPPQTPVKFNNDYQQDARCIVLDIR